MLLARSQAIKNETQKNTDLSPLSYFEKAKVLFEANTVDEYKEKVAALQFPENVYDGHHMIPQISSGLSYEDVATIV